MSVDEEPLKPVQITESGHADLGCLPSNPKSSSLAAWKGTYVSNLLTKSVCGSFSCVLSVADTFQNMG